MDARAIYLGQGVYAVREAARLSGVAAPTIRRWLSGYKYRVGCEERNSPPVWSPDFPRIHDRAALSFRDLMELRFVNYFLQHGVPWATLRGAAKHAALILESSHPFSVKRFRTDGKRIFLEFAHESGELHLLELIRSQWNIPEFVSPRLYEGLDYEDGMITRWHPRQEMERILVDPSISFGQPVVAPSYVPSSVLARAFLAERSALAVAEWYQVDEQSVLEAIGFEKSLVAA